MINRKLNVQVKEMPLVNVYKEHQILLHASHTWMFWNHVKNKFDINQNNIG